MNTDCPICNQKLRIDQTIFQTEDGANLHMACGDALLNIFIRTHTNARSSYTRTITEGFMANARLQLVRSGDVTYA